VCDQTSIEAGVLVLCFEFLILDYLFIAEISISIISASVIMEFDTDKFILDIKHGPALWDLSSDEYSIKNLKKKMWEEMNMMFDGSECTTPQEPNIFSSFVSPHDCTGTQQ
jgi:hypothetical protein